MATSDALRFPPLAHRRTPASVNRYLPPPAPAAPAAASPGRTRLVGASPAMARILAFVERVAPTRAHVLVTGERGTGKELLARLVHERSARAAGRLVVVRCAALDEALVAAELFADAATGGAGVASAARVAQADGGTLVLHQVDALPPALQRRLLDTLRTRQLPRPDGRTLAVDPRIVATSSADLAAEAAAGRFDGELLQRLGNCPVVVPPLRERPEDVAPLVEHFLAETAARQGVPPAAFAPDALRRMEAYPWPGNVRELRDCVTRAALRHPGAPGLPFEPPDAVRPADEGGAPARELLGRAHEAGWDLARLEREYILAVLDATRGHQSRAAQRLGIDRRTLYRKLREYGVKG